MKTEDCKKIAEEQSQEVVNLFNSVDWDIVKDMIKDNKDVVDYFVDEDFIDLDYKDINIGLFKDKNNKVYFPMQNVEVWDEGGGKYYSVLTFDN